MTVVLYYIAIQGKNEWMNKWTTEWEDIRIGIIELTQFILSLRLIKTSSEFKVDNSENLELLEYKTHFKRSQLVAHFGECANSKNEMRPLACLSICTDLELVKINAYKHRGWN